jgi:hypothetical protein
VLTRGGAYDEQSCSGRPDSTELERLAHYREQAAQFRQWAEKETVPEARNGLLDMARQYDGWRARYKQGAVVRRSRESPSWRRCWCIGLRCALRRLRHQLPQTRVVR